MIYYRKAMLGLSLMGLMACQSEPEIKPEPQAVVAQGAVEMSDCFFVTEAGLKQIPQEPLIAFLQSPNGAEFNFAKAQKATAVLCHTETLVPNHNDLKVLLAGFPAMRKRLNEDAEDDVSALEISAGQIRVRTIAGAFTESELLETQTAINALQLKTQGE